MSLEVPRFQKKILVFLAGGAVLSAAVLAVLVIFGVSVNLDFAVSRMEAAASRLAGRKVTIGGPVRLQPGLHPTLEIRHVGVADPDGWGPGELLRVRKALAQVQLVPLLRGRIRFDRVVLDGAALDLRVRRDGRVNWRFQGVSSAEQAPPRIPDLGDIVLRDIDVRYRDRLRGVAYAVRVDELSGRAGVKRKLQLSARGVFRDQPWRLKV